MRNAAALSLMQGRMLAGRRHQARRGDLLNPPPMGYGRGPDGDDQLDPDAQAQRVVRLLFDIFEPQGRRQGVLRSLGAHALRVPMRPHSGRTRGHLEWRRPPRMT
jgi:DNA invertase Pin-like site-specific DNA recombinase